MKIPWRLKYLYQPFISNRYMRWFDNRYFDFRKFESVILKPNLVVIGAQKAGTSSLFTYLGAHPEVFMSHIKEPGLYLDEEDAEANGRIGNYQQVLKIMLHSYMGQRIIGEGSTYYSKVPATSKNIPRNIYTDNPETKLVYLARNPFGRMVSQYLHYIDTGKLKCSFDEFLLEEPTHLNRSLYFFQLSGYLKHFDPKQIKVILFEEMITDTASVLEDLCKFLDIDHSYKFAKPQVMNPSESRNRIDKKDLLIPEEQYQEMLKQILEDKQKLEEFVGRKIDCWDLSKEKWCSVS